MCHGPRRTLAALLVTAVLSLPTAALATPSPGEAYLMSKPAVAVPPGKEGPVPAEVEVSREEAVTAARKAFAMPAELGEPNASISQSPWGAIWNLSWQTSGKEPYPMNVSVTVDAMTGAIQSYSRWVSVPESAPLAYTRSEAHKVAVQWLEKLVTDTTKGLRYADNPLEHGYYGGANAVYQFRWERLVEGYPVQGDGVTIGINARTGELEQFYLQWRRDATFALPDSTLPREKAEAAYRELLPLALQYNRFAKPGLERGQWRLVYRSLSGSYPSLGQDGTLVDPFGNPVDLSAFKEMKPVPAPDQPYRAPLRLLSREEALALARSVTGRSDEPTNSHYNESGEPQTSRTWDFSWYKEGELKEGEYNTSAGVDVERGIVTNFNNWGPSVPAREGEEPTVSEGEARARAIAFIRNYRPDLAGNAMVMGGDPISLKEKLAGMRLRVYRIRFVRLHQSIPVMGQEGSVEIDARTGAVRSFWSYPSYPAEDGLPIPEGLISAADATRAFLRHQGIEPTWVTFWAPARPGDSKAARPDPQLVWAPRSGLPAAAIDAVTGTLLDDQGRDLVEVSKRPADIDGHFAQREIELLWARGIFELKGGRFNPSQPVTVEELARWLVMAQGLGPFWGYDFRKAFAGRGAGVKLAASPEAPHLGAAFQHGILKPEDFAGVVDPTAPVTREVFALWAVRIMGYGRIAGMAGRIPTAFADGDAIGARYANAVAILQGLGIVKGNGQGFAPKRNLTRGEAVKILFAAVSEVRR